MGFSQEFAEVYAALEKIPGLQRRDWELNQSGVDRGMEAVLIQRTTGEVATYALVHLRVSAMPELRAASGPLIGPDGETEYLLSWAETQKPKPSSLLNVVRRTTDGNDGRRLVALAVLKY